MSDIDTIAKALIDAARIYMHCREYRSFRRFINDQIPAEQPDLFGDDQAMRVQRMPQPRSKVAKRRVADRDVQRPAKRRRIHSWRRNPKP